MRLAIAISGNNERALTLRRAGGRARDDASADGSRFGFRVRSFADGIRVIGQRITEVRKKFRGRWAVSRHRGLSRRTHSASRRRRRRASNDRPTEPTPADRVNRDMRAHRHG